MDTGKGVDVEARVLRQLHTLFAMPAARTIKLTPKQRTVLDTILIGDGRLGDSKYPVSKQALRNAIKAGLVEVLMVSPAIYRVTPVGRAVRSSRMARKDGAQASSSAD